MRQLVAVLLISSALAYVFPVSGRAASGGGDSQTSARGERKAVRQALENPNFDMVRTALMTLGNAGSASARHMLGMMYIRGVGVDRDPCEALSWFNRAAELDHPPSLTMIGKHHELGLCTPRNFDAAANSYRMAAALDASEAGFLLAVLYLNSDWSSSDLPAAFAWAQRALETAGNEDERDERRALIGMFYVAGDPVETNFEESEALVRPAAERGFAWAQYFLSIVIQAIEPPRPLDEVLLWTQLAADQGNRLAMDRRDRTFGDYDDGMVAAAKVAAREKLATIAAEPGSALAAGARWCRSRRPGSYDCLRFARDAHLHCALGLPETEIEAHLVRTQIYDRCRTALHEFSSANGRPWPNPEFTGSP